MSIVFPFGWLMGKTKEKNSALEGKQDAKMPERELDRIRKRLQEPKS